MQEIGHLFLHVDFHGSFRAQERGCAQEYRDPKDNLHTAFKPVVCAKVASLHRDLCFNRWMWVVSGEFEILKLETINVFDRRI